MTDAQEADLIQPGLPVGDAIDFLRLIWAVDHALQRRSKSMAAALNITGPQRLVIRISGRFPGIHAKQLADILHLHPSSLTALLKRLERRGLEAALAALRRATAIVSRDDIRRVEGVITPDDVVRVLGRRRSRGTDDGA